MVSTPMLRDRVTAANPNAGMAPDMVEEALEPSDAAGMAGDP